jgi:hypothetical protein
VGTASPRLSRSSKPRQVSHVSCPVRRRDQRERRPYAVRGCRRRVSRNSPYRNLFQVISVTITSDYLGTLTLGANLLRYRIRREV